ncbi:BadF/BadG/BcrA/BcrD ATPase family protein [Primorskyibacter marinus]|uniref:BadF/BadG/BcrA/BcrD ATPase family protein n=1 Tax=Primorskyibacter marinus TaxID=1977320 RepID=UPI000E30199F|nr:BadF/BadG/BcrA/BcrD ATPase family protein [Primorskyibacter marinus]
MRKSQLFIGVDSGGTLCRAVIEGPRGRVETAAPGCNWTTDPARTIAAIRAVLRSCAVKAGLAEAELRHARAHIGAAGIVSSSDATALSRALDDLLGEVTASEDLECAVAGALGPSGDGFVAGLGTGSFLAGRQQGTVRRVGGWGLVLGDEASGAWLGRALLARALHVRDGLAEPSALVAKVMDRFGNDPAALVRFASTATPADFAVFAPLIAEALDAGDPAAADLLNTGAGWIERGLHRLGWRPGARLCLLGGLGPLYTRALPAQLSEAVAPPVGTALDGALALARQAGAAQG